LSGAEQIAACENYGDGLRLDGSGYGVTLLGDCAEQLGRKPEILERRFDVNLLMVYQEEDSRAESPAMKPLLKSAREDFRLRTGSGGCTALEKFGELEGNREEACDANRITRNRNLGAHYTEVWDGALGFLKGVYRGSALGQPLE